MAHGLLGRIARHPLRPGRNQAEDRLTEVFAAILAHPECRGLAELVVGGWLELAIRQVDLINRAALEALRQELSHGLWDLRVITQLVVAAPEQRRRPDLVLRFESGSQSPLEVWVEVKHGTGPSRDQLRDYVAAQRRRDIAHGAVLLLAPRSGYDWFDPGQIPASVPKLTWQHSASLLARYEPPSELAGFLVDELRCYLKEEALMDPERITPEHLVAFAHHREAFEALELVCEIAAAFVADAWAPLDPEQYGSRSRGESWWLYPSGRAGEPTSQQWAFAWHLFHDASSIFTDGRRGVPRLTTGASGDPGTLAHLAAEKLEQVREAGFQPIPKEALISNSSDRIWRLAYPEEVLAGATLDAQGAGIGRWIVDSFQVLHGVLAT